MEKSRFAVISTPEISVVEIKSDAELEKLTPNDADLGFLLGVFESETEAKVLAGDA